MEPKKYIKEIRKITITQAAGEIGVSRQHLNMICNGQPGGRRLAEKFEIWSNGDVSQSEIMCPQE